MTRTALSIALFAATLALWLSAAPVQAQMRVFVAAQGSDSNPCTFALPCRTFQHAHDTVAAGGEIDVLDPAGYGMLTISKAISIQGHGFSGISVASGNAITINAGSTDIVDLNGLIIQGGGAGTRGIYFTSGQWLTVENCIIRTMQGNGLSFLSSATTLQRLSVSNSYFMNNTSRDILIEADSSGAIRAVIDRSGFYGNGLAGVDVIGSFGTGSIDVAVTDSIAGNGTIGFLAESSAGHSPTRLVLTRATASGNSIGVEVTGTGTLRLVQSTVTGNLQGYSILGSGIIFSYGDNAIDDNGSNTGSLTGATKQ
jgi:hypothetical protein